MEPTRADFIDGLRSLATWLEVRPDVPITIHKPITIHTRFETLILNEFEGEEDNSPQYDDVRKAMGQAEVDKDDSFVTLRRTFGQGSVGYHFSAPR